MSEGVQRKLAAIVAADVVGYSRLMGADEAGTHALLKAHRAELIDSAIANHGGRIIKTTGDGMLAEFPSVVVAVECCVQVQDGMLQRNADVASDRAIRFRIGVHLGDVIVDGDDIFGDGVNVAARVEGLSEPDGLALSDDAYRQVRDRLEISWEDGGEHEVKNIARPVHVWRWAPSKKLAAAVQSPDAIRAEPSLQALMDEIVRPTLAVLPFQNMSRDEELGYFCDGLTENLITDLSSSLRMDVAARNSSFRFKGQGVDVREAAKTLGVRYLIEGSVQSMGPRIRVNAQLIDVGLDRHVWADRFDHSSEDLFAVQDKLCDDIMLEVDAAIISGDGTRNRLAGTEHAEARRHLRHCAIYLGHYDQEGLLKCQQSAEAALAIEATSPGGLIMGSAALALRALYGWTDKEPAFEQSLAWAERLRSETDWTELGSFASVFALMGQRHFDEAVARVGDAARTGLATSAAVRNVHGRALNAVGRFDAARSEAMQAIRLQRNSFPIFLCTLGIACLMAGDFDDAVIAFRKFRELGPRLVSDHTLLAAALGAAGRDAEAHAVITEIRRVQPTLTRRQALGPYPFKDPAHYAQLEGYLRDAGLST